jgi:hypothetical protein
MEPVTFNKTKESFMLATIVYALNPNQANPVEGFTSFSPTEEQALKRKGQLISDIYGGAYKKWSGEARRHFIDRCMDNGWEIQIKFCMIG